MIKSMITKSSTLIISSAIENRLKTFNYKVMILRRDKKMKVAPDFHVNINICRHFRLSGIEILSPTWLFIGMWCDTILDLLAISIIELHTHLK